MADIAGFDAEKTEPAGDFEALPVGKYEAVITESEWTDNSSGNGKHLKLVLAVVSGPYANRTLWHRLNLDNPSQKAVEIAKGQLSSICRAVGVLRPRDTTELHNLPMIVRVDIREYEGNVYNDVKAFHPKDKPAAPAATGKPANGGPKQPATAPWKR